MGFARINGQVLLRWGIPLGGPGGGSFTSVWQAAWTEASGLDLPLEQLVEVCLTKWVVELQVWDTWMFKLRK